MPEQLERRLVEATPSSASYGAAIDGEESGDGGEPQSALRNHNVVLSLVVCVLAGMADSIWATTALMAFMYILTGKNSVAGYVEASNGVAEAVTALPVGYLADKFTRSSVIRCGGLVTFVAAGATVYAVLQGEHHHHTGHDQHFVWMLLMGCMALWGVTSGIIEGPVQALYADSIPAGQRSKFYVYLYGCYVLANAMGPVISIGVFTHSGNQWHVGALVTVIIVGIGLELVCAVAMMFFDDAKALTDESDDESSQAESVRGERARKWQWTIPYILSLASLVFGLGSGLTIRFFPLYFKNACGLSPVAVQTVFAVMPIAAVAASAVAQRLSESFGRAQVILVSGTLSTACLLALVLAKPIQGDWRFVAPLFVAHEALASATYPLEESVLMDFVPRESRARWKSVEGVSSFGWCGSAMVGGLLADSHGYTFSFLVTVCFEGASLLLLLPLLVLVPKREGTTSQQLGED